MTSLSLLIREFSKHFAPLTRFLHSRKWRAAWRWRLSPAFCLRDAFGPLAVKGLRWSTTWSLKSLIRELREKRFHFSSILAGHDEYH